jgi:hypothetical protein
VQDEGGIKSENKTAAVDCETEHQHRHVKPIVLQIPQTVLEEYRCRDQEHRRAEKTAKSLAWGTLGVILAYTLFSGGMWLAMLAANRNAGHALEVSQRAYVSLGRPDGKLAELFSPDDHQGKTKIVLYFTNSGNIAASRFFVVSYRQRRNERQITVQIQHIERWKDLGPRAPGGIVERYGGPDLGARSVGRFLLGPAYDLSPDELTDVKTGKEALVVQGSFEYCDGFGRWRCRKFGTLYEPPPSTDLRSNSHCLGNVNLKFLMSRSKPTERNQSDSAFCLPAHSPMKMKRKRIPTLCLYHQRTLLNYNEPLWVRPITL